MKISNGYFKHPLTGEIIKPGEMYSEFDKGQIENSAEFYNSVADDFDDNDLFEYSLSELKKIAKDKKINGYSKLNKEELIFAIENVLGAVDDYES